MRRLFLENIFLKTAALFLAVLLWFFVSSRGQTETAMTVPIEYANVPEGIEIFRHGARTATIVIRGHETRLKGIRHGDVRVLLDVGKAREGEAVLQIRHDDVKLPRTATVAKVEPASVRLVFESTLRREVAVRPSVAGSPAPGYRVRAVEVSPEKVLIEGAQSEVRRVNSLKTEPVDITGADEDIRQSAELDLAGRNIRTRIDEVNVAVRIGRSVR